MANIETVNLLQSAARYNINTCDCPDLVAAHQRLNRVCSDLHALREELDQALRALEPFPSAWKMKDALRREAAARDAQLCAMHDAAEAEFERLHAAWVARQSRRAA